MHLFEHVTNKHVVCVFWVENFGFNLNFLHGFYDLINFFFKLSVLNSFCDGWLLLFKYPDGLFYILLICVMKEFF